MQTTIPKKDKSAPKISASLSIRADQNELLVAVKAAAGLPPSVTIQQLIDRNWDRLAKIAKNGL